MSFFIGISEKVGEIIKAYLLGGWLLIFLRFLGGLFCLGGLILDIERRKEFRGRFCFFKVLGGLEEIVCKEIDIIGFGLDLEWEGSGVFLELIFIGLDSFKRYMIDGRGRLIIIRAHLIPKKLLIMGFGLGFVFGSVLKRAIITFWIGLIQRREIVAFG